MGVFFLFREAIQYVLCLPQLRQRDVRLGPFSFPFGLILFYFFSPSFFLFARFATGMTVTSIAAGVTLLIAD
jgi:hypothetical protein